MSQTSSTSGIEITDAPTRPVSLPGKNRQARQWVLVAVVYAGLLLAWELAIDVFQVPSYVLAKPSQIVVAFGRSIVSGTFLNDAAITATEAFSGLGLAVVAGVLVATLITEVKFLERLIYPLMVMVESMPKIALAPLLIIWLGIGIESKIALAALVAFFPILVNTQVGLRSYEEDAADLFRSIRAGLLQTFFRLKVPSALPSFFAALRMAFVFSMLGAVTGEFIGGSSAGLGYALLQQMHRLDIASVFALLLMLSLIGMVGERVVALIGRVCTPWHGANRT